MRTLRLVLASEHALFRAGLRSLLEALPGIKVVGDSGSGREAVSMAKTLQPAAVVLERDLAELSGLEAIGQILHFSPATRVLFVLGEGDRKSESRALEMGAAGILSRNSSPRDLEHLLHSVREGRTAEPEGRARSRRLKRGRGASLLTPRQHEVLKLLSEGSGVKKIARVLAISPKTVETHRAQLMERLHIYDLVGLVRYALREKITRL